MIDTLKIAQCFIYGDGTEETTDSEGNKISKIVLKYEKTDDIFSNISTGEHSFSGENYNIYQLGIQSAPGLQVNLGQNGGTIRIGQTGIFELNLSNLSPLKGAVTLSNLENVLENTYDKDSETFSGNCNYCLIDVIYVKNDGKENGTA